MYKKKIVLTSDLLSAFPRFGRKRTSLKSNFMSFIMFGMLAV